MPRQETHRAGHIVALDSLRGIAALSVAVYHLTAGYSLPALRQVGPFASADLWVPFFFLLSGFVMAYSYGERLLADGRAAGSYLWRRVARIYPLHLATLLLGVGLALATGRAITETGRYSWEALWSNLFLLQAVTVDYRSWNYPAWSISAEMVAYLSLPLIIGPIARCRAGLPLMLGLLMAPALFADALAALPHDGAVATATLLFAAGVALWSWLRERDASGDGLGFLALGLLLAAMWARLDLTWHLPIFALVIAACATNRGRLARLLSARPLIWLGERSYAVYMSHALVEFLIPVSVLAGFGVGPPSLGVAPSLFVLLVALLSVLGLSHLLYLWIERPSREALRRLPTALLRASGAVASERSPARR